MPFTEIPFTSYAESIPAVLEQAGAPALLAEQKHILIKPNLVNQSAFPVTTSVESCEVLIKTLRQHTSADIVIAEGCGPIDMETPQIFDALGYTVLAEKSGVCLVDLNHAPLRKLQLDDCRVFPELYLPEILFESFVISLPVLKAHSLSQMTGTIKNMMGALPPEHYQGRFGSWKKAAFHGQMHESLLDLMNCRMPDFTLMDASVGMAEFHLGGAHCNPPIGKLLAGTDALAIDRRGAELLGFNWREIPYLSS